MPKSKRTYWSRRPIAYIHPERFVPSLLKKTMPPHIFKSIEGYLDVLKHTTIEVSLLFPLQQDACSSPKEISPTTLSFVDQCHLPSELHPRVDLEVGKDC